MAIKRGVSFYSYHQAQFFGEMTYREMCRELHDNLGCCGVEIIGEATVPRFPFPDHAWVADWHSTLARYELLPVTMDGFLDPMRYRDHTCTSAEAAEYIKVELQLAARLGFQNVCTSASVPVEVLEQSVPGCLFTVCVLL